MSRTTNINVDYSKDAEHVLRQHCFLLANRDFRASYPLPRGWTEKMYGGLEGVYDTEEKLCIVLSCDEYCVEYHPGETVQSCYIGVCRFDHKDVTDEEGADVIRVLFGNRLKGDGSKTVPMINHVELVSGTACRVESVNDRGMFGRDTGIQRLIDGYRSSN